MYKWASKKLSSLNSHQRYISFVPPVLILSCLEDGQFLNTFNCTVLLIALKVILNSYSKLFN